MKKTTTTKKTTTKVKVTKPTKSVAKTTAKARTTKPTKSRVASAATKKKVVARKGPLHHAKRIYHLTPKFVHGMLVGAVVGLALVTWIGSTGHASANPAAAPCIKTKQGINVNDKNANTDIKLDNGCGVRKLAMKAWYADSSSGLPHETQRLFAQSETITVKTSDSDYKHLNVTMPAVGCFYQVDLIDVTNSANEGNYPIVEHKTGGNRNCNPTPAYACSALHAVADTTRKVTIDQFNYTATNATFSRASIDWGDATNPVVTPNVTGTQHSYPKDGSYTITLVTYFNITAQNGEPKEKAAPACTFPITVTTATTTTTPGNQQVCDLKTGKIVTIVEGTYDTTLYGPTTAKECNPTTTVTNVSSDTGTPAATATLVKTGPGAIAVIFVLAAIGGYISHHGHHHLKAKKQRRQA